MSPLGSEHLARLRRIGWRYDESLIAALPEGRLARVVAQHRNGYRLHDGETEFTAQPAPHFLRRRDAVELRPAVGDFVRLGSTPPWRIEQVLPRRTLLSRAAAGERPLRQSIAANVDTVFVVMGLDADFNLRRVERYLALIEGSGARPVVVLTKRDVVDAGLVAARRAELAQALPAIEQHALNAKDPAEVGVLLCHLQLGDTAVLVGSSGAGKSTLTNTLLGDERQSTAPVRARDGRGRHTTTSRALILLPSGGCLIDTPGMREIKLTGREELGAAGFADIEALALACRFGDCAHRSEPGCAVRAALESGALDAERWAAHQKLRAERDAAVAQLEAALGRQAQARMANKALTRRLREKSGRG
jgi:ribosome biogenesis GTPase